MGVRDLVVVCSSSRSGSTVFAELLRRSPQLLTFSAEINPHVTIPTLTGGGGCDVVADPSPYAAIDDGLAVLRSELGNDLGAPAGHVDRGVFARHLAWRLTMQWPQEPIDPAVVATLVDAAQGFGAQSAADLFLDLLPALRRQYPSINPYRYDLPRTVVAARFADASPPVGPPAEPVVEMAPFVVPRAWRVATPSEAAATTAVAATPRNAFRLPLLAQAFPNARVRVVHLTRNPAAAVNGLRDGWLHAGFFSCRSDQPLAIDGYTDRFPTWGATWWNYDVPPGWREWTQRPLVDVCTFQWSAAQDATADGATAIGADRHRIAYEDVVGPPDRRAKALTALAAWLEVDPGPLLDAGDLPVVMPTAPPRPRRWQDNAEVLAPLLNDRAIREQARALGYAADPADWE